MEKTISYSQFQSVKRVAQACDPLRVKRDKLMDKITLLTEEYNDLDAQIASLEAGIRQVVGFRVEKLVKKVIEPGVDVNGKPKKTTKYLPTDIVSYDESKKLYVITTPDEPKEETSSDQITDPTEAISNMETTNEDSVINATDSNNPWN